MCRSADELHRGLVNTANCSRMLVDAVDSASHV
jgi:hypothetical protein